MYALFLLYWVCIAVMVAVAARWGGKPERVAAAGLASASLLTNLLAGDRTVTFHLVHWPMFLIDAGLLVLLLWLALKAERGWTLCACAAQLAGTIGHFAKLIQEAISAFSYALLTGFWSYVIMAAVIVGSIAHQRRVARNGADPSWRSSSGR